MPRSPGFSDESRLTEQNSTLIDNVFRDLKNQFDAVADTQMTKDIKDLVATLNSPKLLSNLTIPLWVSDKDKGTLNNNINEIKTLNDDIQRANNELNNSELSNTKRKDIQNQIKDNKAEKQKLIKESKTCLESAKKHVLSIKAPQQFVETHFDSIFQGVETRLGGESNLKDDRNKLKKLCANYIQNLND